MAIMCAYCAQTITSRQIVDRCEVCGKAFRATHKRRRHIEWPCPPPIWPHVSHVLEGAVWRDSGPAAEVVDPYCAMVAWCEPATPGIAKRREFPELDFAATREAAATVAAPVIGQGELAASDVAKSRGFPELDSATTPETAAYDEVLLA